MARLRLAVLFATRNGAAVLPLTLAGFARLAPPDADWRLVAVDNGSTDATADLLQRHAVGLPLQRLTESRPGKNRALNHALEAVADVDAVILTDDDAVPDADFLQAWQAVLTARPDHALFGGRVTPWFPRPVPRWLANHQRHFPELYALNDRFEGDIGAHAIFGPNMAVRRSGFDRVRFDEDIGPDGGAGYAMGSETEFCVRAARTIGARAWFARRPAVRHIVRPAQMTAAFVAARAYRHGRGVARQQRAFAGQPTPARAIAGAAMRSLGHGLAGLWPGPDRSENRWQSHWWRGFRDETWARHAPRPPSDTAAGTVECGS